MTIPITDEMRRRWGFHKHIAQSEGIANADYRPSAKVFVTRGHMRHQPTPLPNTGSARSKGKGRLRGNWDEKYTFGGRPGEYLKRKPNQNPGSTGVLRREENRGPIELPYVSRIVLRNSLEQNGVATATIEIIDQEREVNDDGMGFFYSVLREGFFSPTYTGDSSALSLDEEDALLGEDSQAAFSGFLNAEGKRLTGLLLPNRKLEVFQGYGDELQRSFVGLIDSVHIETIPERKITIECTDFGKTWSTYTFNPRHVSRYPVAFGDKAYWTVQQNQKKIKRKDWGKRFGIPGTTSLVTDLTNIPGYVYGWSGFWDFKTVRAGRIGSAHTDRIIGPKRHNAVFQGENFDKGSYFIDAINQMQELTGYVSFITPEYNSDRDGSGRFTDPTIYNNDKSRYSIGVPYFVPFNIWSRQDVVEQFRDDSIMLTGSLRYDLKNVRKNIYISNTGLKTKNGRPRSLGYNTPHSLMNGIEQFTFLNAGKEYNNIEMSEIEVKILARMIALRGMFEYAQGSFTAPGYPGAMINDQIDILDSIAGQWRRFFVSGFTTTQTLGPQASYQTQFDVTRMDGQIIQRIVDDMEDIIGFDFKLSRKPQMRETSKP